MVKSALRVAPACAAGLVATMAPGAAHQDEERIDRHALVTRHNPRITTVDPWAPLSVGNGGFAMTVDVTGLQTFSDHYRQRGIPLERRIVLSQYLTAIQLAGDFPPQEGGLVNSTWYGKHHTEMIWWHAAHFALWGRDRLLERNLAWYVRALPAAREVAAARGLGGARWPKMIGPDARESPGGNPLIVWNQPHAIHLAELLYRSAPTIDTLARYRDLVLETAEGAASMLQWDDAGGRFNLGPPLWIAQEIYDPATSMNPAYELSYWMRASRSPSAAARAARARSPDVLLFSKGPNNHYTASGHCPQGGADGDLPVHLPAKGALLAAVAMMAGGWDDAPPGRAPGFPHSGASVVRREGLRPLP